MSERIVVMGYGAVGRATVERLVGEGREVVVTQRSAPRDLAPGASFVACDALDDASVAAATRGARQVVLAIGFPYVGALWREAWPKAMRNAIAACQATGARMVFVDNLYMYGPQTAPLSETTPLADYGVKPATRAAITRIWSEAAEAGRLLATALRAPDFYGPGALTAHLGATSIGALAHGKSALLIGRPDLPHDFAYVPDVARAVTSLLDAPDDAYGRAWHCPCAPTRTPRQHLETAAAALGVKLRLTALPAWALRPLGLFSADLRELAEMSFQWDRPYRVDWRRFGEAFWSDPTPFEVGLRETALAFRAAAAQA